MKKLAILGASYLQEPLVLKAKSMGIETHCFAWDNAEAVCKHSADYFYPISVLDKEQILEKCIGIQIDGITTIATDICVPTICFIAEKMGLISNSFESALKSTNKSLMRKAFADANVNSPRSFTVENYEENIVNGLDFPLIVKPTDRSGSRGVAKVFTPEKLKEAIETAVSESIGKQAVIEEFVEGDEVSVETISWNGNHHILTITDKITTGEPHFVELEHHQPSSLSEKAQDDIRIETIKALNALGIKFGAGHAEFKITKSGKVIAIEVGARMGGDFIGSHLVPLSAGYDYLQGVIDVALSQFEAPKITENKSAGVYFLCKETEHLLPYFQKANPFDIEKSILKQELSYIASSSDRSGYLIYRADEKVNL